MIKMKVVKYNTTADSPEYKEITKKAKKLGYKLFDSWHPSTAWDWLDKVPDEVTIETKHLFNNQYNTVEGHRVFDWKEEIRWSSNGQRTSKREGYYLTGDVDALRKAKESRCSCGYCGKQYDAETAPKYCTKCVGSEYLKESDLYLLVILPLMAERKKPEEQPAEILQAWQEIQPEMERQRAEAARLRLIQKADRLHEEARKKAIEVVEEANIICKLLRAGIDTSNLIHYTHTDKWVWGWSKELSESEVIDLETRIRQIPGGDSLVEMMEFKQQKGA